MRELDITSLAIAALIGGVILSLINKLYPLFSSDTQAFIVGVLVGGSVQVGVRATGVS